MLRVFVICLLSFGFHGVWAEESNIGQVLDLVDAWKKAHPNQYVIYRTSSPMCREYSEFFQFIEDGSKKWIMTVQGDVPSYYSYIAYEENEDILAFFPLTSRVVVLANKSSLKEMRDKIGHDVTSQVRGMLEYAKASSLRREDGNIYVNLDIDLGKLNSKGVGTPGVSQLTVQLRIGGDGKVNRITQNANGILTEVNFDYKSFDLKVIKEKIPKLPSPSLLDKKKTFEQALQEMLELKVPSKVPSQNQT